VGGYIANRIVQSIINIFFITILVFLLARATGDPADVFIDDALPEEAVIASRKGWGWTNPCISSTGCSSKTWPGAI
jgi:ABC-type dipeptide/oligopeptide/nickel transport system permease component